MLTKCKYCGNTFVKTHNRQVYCSEICRKNGRLEQKANYQRNYRLKVKKGLIILNESQKYGLGSGFLSSHKKSNFELEFKAIRRERNRLHV